MNLKLSELHGRDVLNVESATIIGRIDHAVIDSPNQQISALTVAKADDGRTILPWADIKSVGPDAVTVEGVASLRRADGAYEAGAVDGTYQATGKQALTTEGDAMGVVDDVILDVDAGTFVALLIDGSEVPASRVLAVGDFAVIVDVE